MLHMALEKREKQIGAPFTEVTKLRRVSSSGMVKVFYLYTSINCLYGNNEMCVQSNASHKKTDFSPPFYKQPQRHKSVFVLQYLATFPVSLG